MDINTDHGHKWDNEWETKLGKRISYILRYGAEKEGLVVHEGGFVDFTDLMRVPLLKSYEPYDVLKVIRNSTSYRGPKRFENVNRNNTIYVRATHFRRIERNPHHEGTKVSRLLDRCMVYICENILMFDMNGFPDEFLLNSLIHRMKRHHQLNNKTLKCLLSSTMEVLDLEGVFLTQTTLRMVALTCTNIRVLSLKNCGYAVTDDIIQNLLKNTPVIESLNLMLCTHLTDKVLDIINTNCKNLQLINLCGIQLSESALINFVVQCPSLRHLDIWGIFNLSNTAIETLIELACAQNLTIVHQDIKDKRVAPVCPNENLIIQTGLVT